MTTQYTTAALIDGDVEIAEIQITITRKNDAPEAVSSTLHNRAVALWLAQHGEPWMKHCIENGMSTLN
jgi:hypothetical protein